MSAPIVLLAGAALGAIPQPPRRPPEYMAPAQPQGAPPPAAQPEAPANLAPQKPATAPTTVPSTQRVPVDVDPATLKPFNLPPASRQRMRLCGERWRDLKMAGKSEGLTWRSFAEKCLPAKD
ncbi:hypothetical protein [Candidatus Rhodoblastus alkanivorans]|uniref:Uncharacterized protein n=1 Tax=Candidatus Rhodoblastus alkanivorans TaxID=2954117 RepID=A0ABS9Z9Q4_9HYPH|nr:hypothetical protein [Candidatus Rhodoblastus alkanivorans]MCI4683927.1 hypothetical protein [Candidatus Rhodoblastus alkanivorans]